MVVIPDSLNQLSAQELRELLSGLMTKVAQQDQQIASNDRELVYRQTKIDQLTHEMAVLKRHQFGRSREQLDSTQVSLLEPAKNVKLPYLAASCSELSLPALLRETSQCGLVRAEFRRMTGPFGVFFKPTTAVVGFLAAGALEHEAPQTIGTPYAMLQFAPEIDAYDFRHAEEKGRITIDSLNQFKHFILLLFEVDLLKLLFHTSFLALTWIKELQMKLTFRWGFFTSLMATQSAPLMASQTAPPRPP